MALETVLTPTPLNLATSFIVKHNFNIAARFLVIMIETLVLVSWACPLATDLCSIKINTEHLFLPIF